MIAVSPGRERASGRRVLATIGLVLLVASVTGILLAPAASAHAYLTSSNPTDGAVLDQAPGRLVLHFSESVVLPALTVTVVDGDGHPVAVGPPTLVEATANAGGAEAPVSVQLSLPHLLKGSYRVSWETVSSDDLHRAAGVLVFGVRTTVVPRGWVESGPDPLESALRWVVLVAIATAVGAPLARALLRRAGPGVDSSVMAPVLGLSLALGLIAAAALLTDQIVSSGGAAGALVSGGYAARWAMRTGGLALALLATLPSFPRPGAAPAGRGREGVIVLGAALAALGTAMLGHSGAGLVATPIRVTTAALHIVAIGCWMGTLALLLVVLVRQRPTAAVVRRVLRAFGPVAATAVGVMVVTGLYLANGVIGSVDALLLTEYGRLLVLKVLLVLGCGVLALVTRWHLRRHHRTAAVGATGVAGSLVTPGRPMVFALRLVIAEVVLGALVLGVTGLLSSGQPALERQLMTDPSTPVSTAAHARVADLEVSMTIRPNLPGQNVAVVRVTSSRRPEPGRITSVTLGVVGAGPTAAATSMGDDQWSVPMALTEPGPGSVHLTVARGGLTTATGDLAWTTGWPPGATPPLVSRTPLGPVLGWAALVALVLFGLAVMCAIRSAAVRPRRRGPTRRVQPPTVGSAPDGPTPRQPMTARHPT